MVLTATGGFAGVAVQWRRAEAQRRRAEVNFDLAREAVDDYLTTVSQNTLLKSELPGLQPLRKELLEKALRYYQEFLRQRGDDPAQREATAAAFYRVGDITGEIGAKPAALEALGRATQPVRGAVPRPPHGPGLPLRAGPVLSPHRRHPEVLGPPSQAATSYRRAISLGEGLDRIHPENAEFLGELALSYRGAGLLQQAIEVGEKLAREHPAVPEYQDDLARSYFLLGVEHEFAGRLEEALKYASLAYAIRERLVRRTSAPTRTSGAGWRGASPTSPGCTSTPASRTRPCASTSNASRSSPRPPARTPT